MSMNGVSDELEVDLTLTEINSPAISIVYTNKVSLTYPRQCVAIDNQLSFDSNDDYFTVRGFSDQRVHAYARSADTLSYIGEFNACNGSIRFAGVDGAHSYPVFGESTLRSPSLDEVTSRDLIELDVEHLVITHPLFSGPELDSYLLAQTGFSIGRSDVVTTDAAAEAEFAALFQNEIMKSKQSYGEAFIQAKKQFAENGGSDFKDILWGVTLLGDPLLAL